jgi:hypothetical protein
MEDMEFLRAVLAETNANMKSNSEMMKSNQEKAEANRKADCGALKKMMHANQERLEAKIDTNREID